MDRATHHGRLRSPRPRHEGPIQDQRRRLHAADDRGLTVPDPHQPTPGGSVVHRPVLDREGDPHVRERGGASPPTREASQRGLQQPLLADLHGPLKVIDAPLVDPGPEREHVHAHVQGRVASVEHVEERRELCAGLGHLLAIGPHHGHGLNRLPPTPGEVQPGDLHRGVEPAGEELLERARTPAREQVCPEQRDGERGARHEREAPAPAAEQGPGAAQPAGGQL